MKLILALFLSLTYYTFSQLEITEKQPISFGTIVKSLDGARRIEPQDNLILNLQGIPGRRVTLYVEEQFNIDRGITLKEVAVLNRGDLILNNFGELDVEITGVLEVNSDAMAETFRQRINLLLYVEYGD